MVANVVAGCVVLALLGRWLPAAVQEHLTSDQTADELRNFTAVDGMTGLFNKWHFDILAAAEVSRCSRYSITGHYRFS